MFARRSLILAAGIGGPVLFVVVFLVEGATRPGYDPVRQFVSLLALGDRGWVQVASFIVSGTLLAAFGLGLRGRWTAGPGARAIPRLVAAIGLGLVWSGIFGTDPAQGYPPGTPAGLPTSYSWHADLHFLGAAVFFVGLAALGAISARRAARSGAGFLAGLAAASAVAVIVGWVGAFVVPGTDGVPGGYAGLLQRIAAMSGFAWVAGLAILSSRATGPFAADV